MNSENDKENLQPEEQGERKCHQCGESSEKMFCSDFCRRQYIEDNETD